MIRQEFNYKENLKTFSAEHKPKLLSRDYEVLFQQGCNRVNILLCDLRKVLREAERQIRIESMRRG